MDDGGKGEGGDQEENCVGDKVFHGSVWCEAGPDRSGWANGSQHSQGVNPLFRQVVILDLDALPTVNVVHAKIMDEAAWEWLRMKRDATSAFSVEKEARRLENTPNAGPIAAQLYRAWSMQQDLLQQATNRIAALELQLMESQREIRS